MKNEKCTLQDLEYGENTENHEKCEIRILGREIWRRKLKELENRKKVYCRTGNMARTLKIMENERSPLDDLKNDKITENPEKGEMHTVGPGIWREN